MLLRYALLWCGRSRPALPRLLTHAPIGDIDYSFRLTSLVRHSTARRCAVRGNLSLRQDLAVCYRTRNVVECLIETEQPQPAGSQAGLPLSRSGLSSLDTSCAMSGTLCHKLDKLHCLLCLCASQNKACLIAHVILFRESVLRWTC